MRHVWSVICGGTSIDVRSNNISLFDVRERLMFQLDNRVEETIRQQVGHLPVPLQVEFVTLWMRDDIGKPEVAKSRLVVLAPNNREQILYETEIDLSAYPRNRNIAAIQAISFEGNGIYLFLPQIYENDNWQTVAEIPLEVIQEKAETASE